MTVTMTMGTSRRPTPRCSAPLAALPSLIRSAMSPNVFFIMDTPLPSSDAPAPAAASMAAVVLQPMPRKPKSTSAVLVDLTAAKRTSLAAGTLETASFKAATKATNKACLESAAPSPPKPESAITKRTSAASTVCIVVAGVVVGVGKVSGAAVVAAVVVSCTLPEPAGELQSSLPAGTTVIVPVMPGCWLH